MKKDIVDIVLEKEFIQLTTEEREELSEFCTSESEYVQLKSVFKSVENMTVEEMTPRPETKERLDQLFDETYPKVAPVWYNSVLTVIVPKNKPIYRQPLVQIAALAILFLLTIPLFNSNLNDKNVQVANNEMVEEEGGPEELNEDNINGNNQASTESLDTDVLDNRSAERLQVDDFEVDEERLDETLTLADESTLGGAAAPLSSSHPDGVFEGTVSANVEIAYSLPVSESEDLLDLLTTSF